MLGSELSLRVREIIHTPTFLSLSVNAHIQAVNGFARAVSFSELPEYLKELLLLCEGEV